VPARRAEHGSQVRCHPGAGAIITPPVTVSVGGHAISVNATAHSQPVAGPFCGRRNAVLRCPDVDPGCLTPPPLLCRHHAGQSRHCRHHAGQSRLCRREPGQSRHCRHHAGQSRLCRREPGQSTRGGRWP
jgi:hypothetical protein